jgi:hypothetical protein
MLRRLIRYAGPAAMVGGALYIATFAMVYLIYGPFEEQAEGTFFRAYDFIYLFYTPMYASLLLGAVGLYLRQGRHFGLAGKAGFYLTALGFSLGATGSAVILGIGLTGGGAGAVPQFVTHALAHAFYALGSLLLGFATFRASVLPRVAAVMMGVGPAWQLVLSLTGVDGSYLLLLFPFAITALGWMWLGHTLLAEKDREAGAPRVV